MKEIKFHIRPDYTVSRCHASIRPCPYGENLHFTSEEEAKRVAEELAMKRFFGQKSFLIDGSVSDIYPTPDMELEIMEKETPFSVLQAFHDYAEGKEGDTYVLEQFDKMVDGQAGLTKEEIDELLVLHKEQVEHIGGFSSHVDEGEADLLSKGWAINAFYDQNVDRFREMIQSVSKEKSIPIVFIYHHFMDRESIFNNHLWYILREMEKDGQEIMGKKPTDFAFDELYNDDVKSETREIFENVISGVLKERYGYTLDKEEMRTDEGTISLEKIVHYGKVGVGKTGIPDSQESESVLESLKKTILTVYTNENLEEKERFIVSLFSKYGLDKEKYSSDQYNFVKQG